MTYFIFVYRSPSLSNDQTRIKLDNLSDTINIIRDKSPSAETVIAGDFNMHNPTWLQNSGKQDASSLSTEPNSS